MPWFYCLYSVADSASVQQPAIQSLSDDAWSCSQTAQNPTTGSKEQEHRPPQDVHTHHQVRSEKHGT